MRPGDEALASPGRLIFQGSELGGAQRGEDRVQRRFGLGTGDAGAQPADEIDPVRFAVGEVIPLGLDDFLHGDGHVEGGERTPLHALEARGSNADDGEGHAVDEEGLADDGGFGEVGLPEVEVEDGDGVLAGRGLIARKEEATEGRLHAEHGEIIAADHLGGDGFGAVIPLDADVGGGRGDETAEDSVPGAEVLVHRPGEFVAVIGSIPAVRLCVTVDGAGKVEDDQLLRIGDRQQAHEGLIEQAEDGSVGSDG
jgi:hypothetical protein